MIRSEKSAGFSDSDSCAEEEDEANPTCSPICRNRAKDSAISFSMIIVGGMKMGIMIGKTKRNNRIAKKTEWYFTAHGELDAITFVKPAASTTHLRAEFPP